MQGVREERKLSLRCCGQSKLHTQVENGLLVQHTTQTKRYRSNNRKAVMEQQWLEAQVPFSPFVGKGGQASLAFLLMAIAFVITGFFSLNKSGIIAPILVLPASLAFGFGSVFLICAAGVYV